MVALARSMIRESRTVALFAVAFALTTIVAAACSSTSGTPEATPTSDAAPADATASPDASTVTDGAAEADVSIGDAADGGCALDLGTDASACEVCQSQKCCATVSASQQAPGAWTNSAATVCTENQCATECGVAAPVCGGITPSPASCLAALDAMCCAQVTACGQSDQCVAVIYLCIDNEGNDPGSSGFDTCAAAYPDGLQLFNVLNTCFTNVSCN
jgi:hypothetical protein